MTTLSPQQFPQPDGAQSDHDHCLHDNDNGAGQYCCKSGCSMVSNNNDRYRR